MTILESLNEARKAATKEDKRRLALDIKQIMMRNFGNQAHQILARDAKQAKAKKGAQPAKQGTASFYNSRSGADLTDFVENLQQGPTPSAEKKDVVRSKSNLEVIKSNTYAAMDAMNDDELDQLFGSDDDEKEWLRSEGYSIHTNAGAEVTRKRTRLALVELSANDEEE